MNKSKDHELVIIGAGPGGYRAAFMASDLGLNVTLIDPEINPGGVCLYRGCIPTKALLYLANLKREAARGHETGMSFESPKLDIKKIREWKTSVVERLTGGLGQLVNSRKLNYIRGKARFADAGQLEVSDEKGKTQKITFKNAIIATGAKAVSVPGLEPKSKDIIHSAKALDIEKVPEKFLIVGGGYIGLEMANIYHALGAEVTITELTKNFLPGLDPDLISEFKRRNKDTFHETYFETKVKEAKKKENKMHVTFENKKGKTHEKTFNQVLVAVGHKPLSDELALENTRVDIDDKGFIKVDNQQRTSVKNIFAIGDVVGGPMLAHKASYEGRIAAEVIAGKNTINDSRVIPAVIYTEPEIATCGLSETEAKKRNIDYKKAKFPWGASGRAITMNENGGFTKFIIDPKSERILGGAIVGKNAGELISEIALAIEMAATAEDIALTVHPHPTLSETVMETAEQFYGHPVHTFKKRNN